MKGGRAILFFSARTDSDKGSRIKPAESAALSLKAVTAPTCLCQVLHMAPSGLLSEHDLLLNLLAGIRSRTHAGQDVSPSPERPSTRAGPVPVPEGVFPATDAGWET